MSDEGEEVPLGGGFEQMIQRLLSSFGQGRTAASMALTPVANVSEFTVVIRKIDNGFLMIYPVFVKGGNGLPPTLERREMFLTKAICPDDVFKIAEAMNSIGETLEILKKIVVGTPRKPQHPEDRPRGT